MINSTFNWHCPNCQTPLEKQQNTWRCINQHTFDVAKESYVNLLLANQKKSKSPGDNKAMINSRRQFLSKGHYQQLAEALLLEIASLSNSEEKLSILDAGCGEGYYLQYVGRALSQRHKNLIAAGIDVSKHAIACASKANQSSISLQYQFAVASCFNLPIRDNDMDLIIQVFAPAQPSEMRRVLKASGFWFKVTPASEHLHELKSYVYESVQLHKETNITPTGFELLKENEIYFKVILKEQECRMNLLAMTPYFWSISEGKKLILKDELKSVTAHFKLSIYRKSN